DLQVQRRLGQTWIAPVEQCGTEQVQPADGAVQKGPDDGLGRRIRGQVIQVALDHGGGVFGAHRATRRPPGGCNIADCTTAGRAVAMLGVATLRRTASPRPDFLPGASARERSRLIGDWTDIGVLSFSPATGASRLSQPIDHMVFEVRLPRGVYPLRLV